MYSIPLDPALTEGAIGASLHPPFDDVRLDPATWAFHPSTVQPTRPSWWISDDVQKKRLEAEVPAWLRQRTVKSGATLIGGNVHYFLFGDDPNNPVTATVKDSALLICRGYCRVVCGESSTVILYDHSTALADDRAVVAAYDNSEVVSRSTNRIYGYDHARITSCDGHVELGGQAVGRICGTTSLTLEGSASAAVFGKPDVVARDRSMCWYRGYGGVRVCGNAFAYVDGPARVLAEGATQVVSINGGVLQITERNPDSRFYVQRGTAIYTENGVPCRCVCTNGDTPMRLEDPADVIRVPVDPAIPNKSPDASQRIEEFETQRLCVLDIVTHALRLAYGDSYSDPSVPEAAFFGGPPLV